MSRFSSVALNWAFRFAVLFGVVLIWIQPSEAAFAQGSLQLVFHPRSGKSTELHPLTANLSNLWCHAAEIQANGIAEKIPITKANFLHFGTENAADKSYIGKITDNRAYLELGSKDLSAAGKYRCEVTTENEEFVHGNMFIYMRPVFHSNGSLRLELSDEKNDNKFELTGPSLKVTRGTTAVIQCPAIGYPKPDIFWFKDSHALQDTEKFQLIRNELHIRDVDDKDEGIYRCIAANEFPPAVDFKETRYEAILDQPLKVTSSLAWLIPLIVIIVILILLFVVIYTCAYWKNRESQRYNVAANEKKLHTEEEQRRLHEVEEE